MRLAELGIEVFGGPDAATEVVRATESDVVVAAITGAAGLSSALETVRRGKRLALANKEALVMAGNLVTRLAAENGAEIVPVDSEHSAIFQALHGEPARSVRRLFLTASGGPFVDLPAASFQGVSPEQALQHPTWKMGPKITIDSATMMNKALEIVEAHWLFGTPPAAIEVLVHRQSIVHSMVEFHDGSILAQLGVPSMTVPIRYAIAYPERARTQENWFDIARFAKLTFEAPDPARFPALRLGARAASEGGLSGAVLNAANEVAVARFLARDIRFDRIAETVERVLDAMQNRTEPSLEEILAADRWARKEAERCLTPC
jgi:1-deoxy-D-xylulose-5-phosphate reductoisomerase